MTGDIGSRIHFPWRASETTENWLRHAAVGTAVAAFAMGLFGDPDWIEVPSTLLLIATAFVARWIFDLRRTPGAPLLQGTARIWMAISFGFLYLALDEVLSIHERIDMLIHRGFGVTETDLTDRIDDFIVLAYGIVGAILLWFHRSEFFGLKGYFRYLALGFFFLCVMVLFDTIGNRINILDPLGLDGAQMKTAHHLVEVVEEFCKTLGETAFLLAFLRIHRQVREEKDAAGAARR